MFEPVAYAPSAKVRERYVQNILTAWHAATPDQVARGRVWYRTAHELATMLSDGNPRPAAGVIAALSANKRWTHNQQLAADAWGGKIHGHTGAVLRKVAAILGGADPEEILPMGSKTGMFFRCINDPTDPDAVVIDRHAHDVAVGRRYGDRDRGLSSKRRYAMLAHCYREAALRLGELPSTVQAVTWLHQSEGE